MNILSVGAGPTISGYKVTGFNLKMYCKLTEINKGLPNYSCTISFDTGMKKFCLIAIYNHKKPHVINIDRIENNELCVLEGKLHNYEKGTVKFIKTALYAIKQLFPLVNMLTLHDDSQIYCDNNSKLFKLSMSYDYTIKYNETWYEKNFNAELPGFISKHYNSAAAAAGEDRAQNPIKIAAENTLMDNYIKSLAVLDEPITNYALIKDMFPQFSDYKDIYESASTPRHFIHLLRKKLGADFCYKVGKWLNQYMVALQIKLAPEFWYISTSNIPAVPGFSIEQIDGAMATRILTGGGKGSKTLKNRAKTGIRFIADSNFTENFVGYYDEV